MSNNYITINDFENICRTCLSRKDLKPLYEKCSWSTNLVDMLMSCTFVKFVEGDGFPVKICTNCIHEINQAFSFAKRCEASDTILRNCAKEPETEFANNSSQSQQVESIIATRKEIEIKPEIILPNVPETAEVVMQDYEFVAVKQEKDEESEDGLKQEELIIENENPADENYEEDGDEDETSSEKSDNSGSERRCNVSSQDSELKVPIGERPHTCPLCGKAFSKLSNLKTHNLIHTGEKLNVCSICGKAFTQKTSLKYHMRMHTGEKPYSCDVCNLSFTQSGPLKVHIRTHTGEKPYSCSLCKKAFTRSTYLKDHMRIHTGEKPYNCEVCGKSFSANWSLTRHRRIHKKRLSEEYGEQNLII